MPPARTQIIQARQIKTTATILLAEAFRQVILSDKDIEVDVSQNRHQI